MFVAYNKVRMHDSDMAGILYFPRLFRFTHDALEDLIETHGMTFDQVFHRENFVFVIVHAEADYYFPMKVGDKVEVFLSIGKIGNSSFTVNYKIKKKDQTLVGRAQTIHVTLDSKSREKISIPETLKSFLLNHYEPEEQ